MVNISDLATFGTQDVPHVKKLWGLHIAVCVISIRQHCTTRKLPRRTSDLIPWKRDKQRILETWQYERYSPHVL